MKIQVPVSLIEKPAKETIFINCNSDNISLDDAITQIASYLHAPEWAIQMWYYVDDKSFFINSQAEYIQAVTFIQNKNEGSSLFAAVRMENENTENNAKHDQIHIQVQSATSFPNISTPFDPFDGYSKETANANIAEPMFSFTQPVHDHHRVHRPYPFDTNQSKFPWPSHPIPANPVIPEHEFAKPSEIGFHHFDQTSQISHSGSSMANKNPLCKQSEHALVNHLWQLGYKEEENYLLLLIDHFKGNLKGIQQYLNIGRVPNAANTRR